jgi:hypothetical protein
LCSDKPPALLAGESDCVLYTVGLGTQNQTQIRKSRVASSNPHYRHFKIILKSILHICAIRVNYPSVQLLRLSPNRCLCWPIEAR